MVLSISEFTILNQQIFHNLHSCRIGGVTARLDLTIGYLYDKLHFSHYPSKLTSAGCRFKIACNHRNAATLIVFNQFTSRRISRINSGNIPDHIIASCMFFFLISNLAYGLIIHHCTFSFLANSISLMFSPFLFNVVKLNFPSTLHSLPKNVSIE